MSTTLVVVNDRKLGDAIIVNSIVSAYQRHTEKKVLVLCRKDYYFFSKIHHNLSVVPFYGKYDLYIYSFIIRLILSVERVINVSGHTKSIERCLKLFDSVPAYSRHRDYAFSRAGDRFYFDHLSNMEYSWGVLYLSDKSFPMPTKVQLPVKLTDGKHILIFPQTAEIRKDISVGSTKKILEYYLENSSQDVYVVLSKKNRNFKKYYEKINSSNLLFVNNIRSLFSVIKDASMVVSADTGTYVLSAALKKNIDVYVGPTQVEKVRVSDDENCALYRLDCLRNDHCNCFKCEHAYCIDMVVDNIFSRDSNVLEERLPSGCLLSQNNCL